MNKCPDCGKEFVKHPVLKDKELGFKKGNINWRNMFRIELEWLMVLIGIGLMIYGFYDATGDCQEIMSEPCDWCEGTGCFDYISEINEWNSPIETGDYLNYENPG